MAAPDWKEIWESLDLDAVEDALGLDVERRRDEDFASCPLSTHSGIDANPSFSINREKGVFSCFACGWGGAIPALVEDVLQVESQTALEWLTEFSDVELEEFSGRRFLDRLERLRQRKLLELERSPALPWFPESRLAGWIGDVQKIDYWEQRRISSVTVDRFRLGYDPAYPFRGYRGPAVIIPHVFEESIVGWQVRWLEDDRPKNIPKYVNQPHDFPKRSTLYGWDQRSRVTPVFVVESTMTALRLHSAGYSAVATFGASIPDEQVRLLRHLQCGAILSFDNDGSGRRATQRVLEELRGHVPLWVVPPPEARKADLGDLDDDALHAQIEQKFPVIRIASYPKLVREER